MTKKHKTGWHSFLRLLQETDWAEQVKREMFKGLRMGDDEYLRENIVADIKGQRGFNFFTPPRAAFRVVEDDALKILSDMGISAEGKELVRAISYPGKGFVYRVDWHIASEQANE